MQDVYYGIVLHPTLNCLALLSEPSRFNMCTESPAVTIVGGGHTSSLVSNRGVVELVTHNSTGGGACLTMLSGGSMPVVESLEKSSQKYRSILSSIDL